MTTITTATLAQIEEITHLYRACGAKMLQHGFDNWGDFYPTVATIRTDIQHQNLFALVTSKNQILGVVVLDEIQPPMFAEVNWQFPSSSILVVHRLAVSPDYQGNGYAKKLMKFAEMYASQQHYQAIRLDAYSINKKLLQFYKNLGYQITKEAISLGAKWKHPFHCFEKSSKQ
jgi:ribosomal protein S18 acetylase RimI-like enzyme